MATWTTVAIKDLERTHRIDSEYYQSIFEGLEAALQRVDHRRLTEVANVSDGNHLSISRYYRPNAGVRYLRGQDISDFFIGSSTPVYIPESVYDAPAMARSRFCPGDVLVSIVGTIGAIALVPARHGKLTGSCKIATVSPNEKAHSGFLAAFLLSKFGQLQIRRLIRGAVQMGLILEDFDQIVVPKPSVDVAKAVESLVTDAQAARAKSVAHFQKAVDALMRHIGWSGHDGYSRLCFTMSQAKDLGVAGRWDAEYFIGRHGDIMEAVTCRRHQRLGDITERLQSGLTPAVDEYTSTGVPMFKVEGLTAAGLAEPSSEYVAKTWAAVKTRGAVSRGNALVLAAAHHPSYIGKTGLIVDDPGQQARAVAELIILEFKRGISAECMTVYLNLPPVRAALQREVRGNTAHLYPKDIAGLPVPFFPDAVVRRVATSFEAGQACEEAAQSGLREAIDRVETFVKRGH